MRRLHATTRAFLSAFLLPLIGFAVVAVLFWLSQRR
jgi:hypothetical protein